MKKNLLNICILAIGLATLASCEGKKNKSENTTTSGTFTMVCDNSFENIMEQEIDVFEYCYPKAHVLCRYATEDEAIDSLLSLNTRTIVIPRNLSDSEVAQLKSKRRHPRWAQIAVDAVALIVNPENPVSHLSVKEISEILSGETNNWQDLNPNYPDKKIQVVFDDQKSSMVKFMRDSILDGKNLGPTATQVGSIKGVIDAVRNDKNAIGVIGVSWLTCDLKSTTIDSLTNELEDEGAIPDMGEIDGRISQSGVKPIAVMRNDDPRPYWPYQQNIYDGTYPLTRQIWMITLASSGSTAGGFFSFVTGTVGQKLIMKTGVMPKRATINIRTELVN